MKTAEAVVKLAPSRVAVPVVGNRSTWQPRYIKRLRRVDLLMVVLAVCLAQRLRFGEGGTDLVYWRLDSFWKVDYTVVSVAVVVVWTAALSICRSRSPRVIGAGPDEYRRVWTATLSVFGGIAILSTVFKVDIARGYLAIALPVGLVGLFVGRLAARRFLAKRRRQGQFLISVLAVGEAASVRALAQSMARSPSYGYAVTGACLTGHGVGTTLDVPGLGQLPVYGREDDLADAIKVSQVDTVALTATEQLGPQGIRDLSWQLEKLDVDLVVSPGVMDVATPRVVMQPVAGLPLIHLEKPRYNGAKRFEKQAFDICFSLLVLLGTLPLLVLVALAIKLNSKGPVFYLSERIGLDGKPFRMVKFRTMHVGADERVDSLMSLNDSAGGVLFKMRMDPRVTSVGRILRKYSIDELPQFINVLFRQMSVVGPRPPLDREVATYDDRVRRRLLVLPGITGLWQVSGRSDLSWEDSVRLDLSYVENWSMIGDLIIALKTIRAILGGSGAY